MPLSRLKRLFVASIGVAHDAHAGVSGEDALDAGRSLGRAISDDDLPGVLAIADAHAAAMMEGDPGGAADSVDERIQDGPIADRVAAILHAFGFAVG